jgi:hypothetical protein
MGMSRSIGKSVLKSLIANKEILKDRLPLKTEFSFANFNDHFKNIHVVQGQPSKKYIYFNQLEIQSKQ